MHRDRKDTDNEVWLTKLKDCLNLQRPIYYSGQGSAGGHAFVCDGYDDSDLLHFNWGWGGNGDGYFALGNLNPIGYSFNSNNYAIFDIIPEYEPCVVAATAYPSTAGIIEGTGEFHIGEQCTLTAVPTESSKFSYWKKDGRIVSQNVSLTLNVENDINDIVAYFSFKPVKEITACYAPDTNDVNSPYVSLSWDFDGIHQWNLLKQFEINGERFVTSDEDHIYTAYALSSDHPGKFGKYTMGGELVEFFYLEGAWPDGITCDGSFFYCSRNHTGYDLNYLYRYDYNDNTLIDSTNMSMQFSQCAYDFDNDGFWLLNYGNHNTVALVNRQGELISGATIPSYYYTNGFGSITAEDGNTHLLVSCDDHSVYDYDIDNGYFNIHRLAVFNYPGFATNASIGKYDGKEALFIVLNYYGIENDHIHIYEIDSHLAPILHYRLYRADNEGSTVTLADEVTGTSYLDTTWDNIVAGEYRFGISEVYFNGVESEIIWSDPIVKTDHGINENDGDPTSEPSIQKVIEDGKIVIIKDGKRYNVSGQHLN